LNPGRRMAGGGVHLCGILPLRAPPASARHTNRGGLGCTP
jgi:hypothetical protein